MTSLHLVLTLPPAVPAAVVEVTGKQAMRFVTVAGQLFFTGGAVVTALTVPRALRVASFGAPSPFTRALAVRAHRVVGILGLLAVVATLLEQPDTLTTLLMTVVAVTCAAMVVRPAAGRAGLLLGVTAGLGAVAVLEPAVPTTWADRTPQAVIGPVASQLHILSGSVWVGGLVAAVLLLTRASVEGGSAAARAAYWPAFWHRFSGLATISLAVIIVSGGWLTWAHVGAFSEMVTTPYGQALSIKLVVVAVMATLGAVNQLHLIPGINRARALGDQSSVLRIALTHFRATVLVEAALGVVVIGIVPFLSGSAPKQTAAAAGSPTESAVLDVTLVATGVLGVAVMVVLMWASTRVSRRRSGVALPAVGPDLAVALERSTQSERPVAR